MQYTFKGEDPDGVVLVAFINDELRDARPPSATIALDFSLVCPKGELT